MAIERELGGAGVTAEQRNAVEEAMRIILEDDRLKGEIGTFECAACARETSHAGSILYAEQRLCHSCATRFELARLERRVRTCDEYVRKMRSSRH